MKIDSNVITDAVIGTPRVVPELGDNSPSIAQTVSPIIKSLCKAIIGIPTGAISPDSSVIAGFSDNKAGVAAATVATLVSLPPGSYTLDAYVTARFVLQTVAAAGLPDVRIDLVTTSLTTGAILVGIYSQDNTVGWASRRLDIIVTESCLIRRLINATIVGQSIEYHTSISVERHL